MNRSVQLIYGEGNFDIIYIMTKVFSTEQTAGLLRLIPMRSRFSVWRTSGGSSGDVLEVWST